MGTAGYMSPEQARGEKLDARTDLFSFGLVLYEMASGHRAFEGDTGPALHNAILAQTPVPPRELNPKLPAKLGQIITKTLEKNRAARYQNVSELRADLEMLKRELKPRNRFRRLFTVTASVVALLVAGTVFWFEKLMPPSTQVPPEVKFRQLTINSSENPVTSGSISLDGKYLAYVDAHGMHVKDIETGATQAVRPPEALKNDSVDWEIIDAAWFPDCARFLANAHPANQNQDAWTSRTTNIWMFSRLNIAPRKLRENAIAWSVSPDGALISFGTNSGRLGEREIWLMGPDGEQARKLFDTDENSSIGGLPWSPDGQRGLFVRTDASGDTILSRDLHGGMPVTVFTPAETKQIRGDFSWLPDGRLIYQVGDPGSGYSSLQDTCNFWAMRLDVHTGKPVEQPRRLTNWTGFCVSSTNATADGKRLAFLNSSGGHATAYVADLEASGRRIRNPRHFTLEEGYDDITDWTADSKTLILVYSRGDHYGLYKQSLNSDTPEPIVASAAGGLLEEAQVSPDGKWVITQLYPIPGGPSEPNQIMRVPITGGSPEPIFRVREGSVFFCARPPSDLCAVAEQSDDRKEMIITAFDPVKGRVSELARFDIDSDFDPKVSPLLWNISPDGTRLAVARGPKGPVQIRSLRGQPTQVIQAKDLNHIRLLDWAADGKGLFVSNLIKGGAEVLHVDLHGNTEVMWKSIGGPAFGRPSPDGHHLAISDWKQSANMWMMENF
jgi:Tol biopolymer transport system component